MIRAATFKDLEDVLALTRDFVVSYPVDEGAFRANYPQLVSDPDTYFGLAEYDGRIAGYILGGLHLTLYANGGVAWIDEIMVDAEHRRLGLGRELMDAFEAWAKQRGSVLVTLATRRAAPFYEALDYRQTAGYFKKELKP